MPALGIMRRVFVDPARSPSPYLELTWADREVEIATGRVASKRAKVQTKAFESAAEASAFVQQKVADTLRRGWIEADPALVGGPAPEPPKPIPPEIASLGARFERVPALAVPLYASEPGPEAQTLYDRADIAGYTPVLLGRFAWELLEEAASDERTPSRQRRARERARRESADDRILRYVSIARHHRPHDDVPEQVGVWSDASVLDDSTRDTRWHLELVNDPGARLALAECTPADLPLALPIHGGNAAPTWSELADVLASWHERYGARLRYTDAASLEIVANRVPHSLHDLRRLAREQALIGCDYHFRFDWDSIEEYGAAGCVVRAAMQPRWHFAYD